MSEVELAGLRKAYGGSPALDGVSMTVAAGELLTVVGPSGSGKTTLLRVIAGLATPDAGAIRIDGRDVTAVPAAERGVAMVFQNFALFPHLSVEGNVAFGLRARGMATGEARERARDAAARLGLAGVLDRRPAALSGGERQRVALARAVAGRAQVVLLDEPLSNLDAPLRAQARDELRRLHADTGATMVHVTHDQAEALALGDRVAVLTEGRLEQIGVPHDVYERPATRFVAGFLGTPPMNLLDAAAADRLGIAAGDAAAVGVRPEHLVPSHDGFAAELELVERAGHDELWRLRAQGATLWMRPPAGAGARAGETVRLAARALTRFGADGRALP
ncbi:MAG: ABC transporter ATP-binding protein [Solirubrobacteraceae bacterium]